MSRKSRIKGAALVFVAVQFLAAFIAWLGGYNFDHRSPAVGGCVALSVFIGIFAALYYHEEGGRYGPR